MEKAFEKAEELAGSIKEYLHTRIESLKLSTAEKISAVIANTAAAIIAAVVLLLFVIFAGVSLSLAVGDWTGRPWSGFLLMAFLFLLLAVIIWKARTKLIRLPVMNTLIKQLFDNDDEED